MMIRMALRLTKFYFEYYDGSAPVIYTRKSKEIYFKNSLRMLANWVNERHSVNCCGTSFDSAGLVSY
jgi:hypothetical protein